MDAKLAPGRTESKLFLDLLQKPDKAVPGSGIEPRKIV